MTSLSSRAACAAVVIAALGCAARADTPREMAPAEVTAWIGFFDKLVATVIKSETTCDKLAVDVSNLVDANQAAVAIARKARAQGRKLPAAAKAHMIDGVKKMVPAMQKCGQHTKVRAAFAKLDLDRRR